mmetsp:Transcript_46185/g.90195  ORF Transcript_46185/g.90195 Transcript_46185/m.90195 type:complete len:128 (+) Transcript_46185:200-583(+)|eukprot:CAMPEP_0194267186 /NCGR_PEP_ID=MMETSP0169-20130528/1799_1 /TAXON_ID=218684 /ORGANISM="Corethron pennatum, Strain L29A3" /LENGTH=127 /DNA_ID=CAMNT_0039007997 /DNA_START=87 /DNA_END=470 /DNA_ORIENTATION=+
MTNRPERTEAFLLDEDAGEVKITYAQDTKVTNAGTFILNREDHTLGNLLRMQLLRDPSVRFAGYRMPHPLQNHVEMKVQTSGGNVSPVESLGSAIEDLLNETDHLINGLNDAVDRYRRENERADLGL